MKREYHLDNDKKKINLKLKTGDVEIYRGNVYKTLLCCTDSYEFKDKGDAVKLTQRSNTNNVFVNGIVINSCSNTSIVVGNNITVVNGKVVSGNVKNINSIDMEDQKVEVIVPHDVDDLSFDISIESGSLTVRDVILKNMAANLCSGNISMYDVDIFNSELNTMSGNIDLEICRSILNYDASLNSMCGRVRQDHTDTINNISFDKKRKLNANTMCGNVNVLFKG